MNASVPANALMVQQMLAKMKHMDLQQIKSS